MQPRQLIRLGRTLVRMVGGMMIAVGLTSTAPSATHTWTGAGSSGYWNNAQNWSGGVPGSGETDLRLIFPAGANRPSNTNNIGDLTATAMTLSGTGYRLAGSGRGTNFILAGTVTASGASNVIGRTLGLTLERTCRFGVTDFSDVLRLECRLTGPGALVKEGAGTLILAGSDDNTFGGLTQVRAGTLRLEQNHLERTGNVPHIAIPNDLEIVADLGSALVILADDDQLADNSNVMVLGTNALHSGQLDLQGHQDEIRSLRGSGEVDFDGGTLIVNQQPSSDADPNQSRSSSGLLNDFDGSPGTLIKRGSGELRFDLRGNTPYYGTLSTLYLDGGTVTLIHPLSNAVIFVTMPGTVLAGTTMAPQRAYAKAIHCIAGEFRPGSAGPSLPEPLYAGQLAMNLSTNSSSTFRAFLRSPINASRVVVAAGDGADGSVFLNSPALEVTCEFSPALNQKFTIIDKVSPGPIIGNFAGLPENAMFTAGGRVFRITYQGGDGNDVVLTRVWSMVESPIVVGPPVLVPNASGDPHVQFSLASVAGQTFAIETNGDLSHPNGWSALDNVTANDLGEVIYRDRASSGVPEKFYRFKPLLPPLPTGPWTIPLSQVPSNLLAAARTHLAKFDPADDDEPNPWADAVFAPTAILLHDLAQQGGTIPAYVELKITSRSPVAGAVVPDRSAEDRGFILLSLTPNDRPIVEFAGEGPTDAETLLRRVQGAGVRKLVRFSSSFLVAEGEGGQWLGSFGTAPFIPVGPAPAQGMSFHRSYDSETDTSVLPSNAPPVFLRAADYRELRTAWAKNPVVAATRRAQALRAAPAWRLINGLRPPSVRVRVGETNRFALNEFFETVALNIDSDEPALAMVRPVVGGAGFEVVGLMPGKQLVRAVNKAGLELHYSLTVTPGVDGAGGGGLGGFMAASIDCPLGGEDCICYDVDRWVAGQGWSHDQPHYYQYEDNNWCDYTGCGPVALSMLAAWWDLHGVPSAFYSLSLATIGQAHNFRFKFDSLATQDAPMDLGEDKVFRNYDDFHELCNVTCEIISGAGSTLPGDLAGAWDDYTWRIMKPLPSPQDEFGQRFVGGGSSASWNYPFTDWEGGGTMVANGIKKGRPGVVGIGWWGNEHYVLAWAYKKYRRFEGCGADQELDEVSRFFKCNMGWRTKRKWLNAEDVWLGLTANLWQRRTPTP